MKTLKKSEKIEARSVELDAVIVKGAREHNLKNIDISIPKKKLVVVTGVSGSGKSSLAFDTIYAEGQRRYVESLSAYARQFIGQMEKPKYETIRGLSPTISIEQKAASKNPRSTVGTITEIYDYLRVLFARVGEQHCIKCGKKVGRGDAESMVKQILDLPPSTKILILAPMVENRKGEHKDLFETLRNDGFGRVRIDGVVHELEDVQGLAKNKKHNIEVVVDRLAIKKGDTFRKRLTDSVETALKTGSGEIIIHVMGREDIRMSEARSCCGIAYPEPEPSLFSFNSPLGMCPECNGIGTHLVMDEEKIVPDTSLTIREGAVVPWKNYFLKGEDLGSGGWGVSQLAAMEEQWGIDFDTPWEDMELWMKETILFGSGGKTLVVDWNSKSVKGEVTTSFEGLVHEMMRRYHQTFSERRKKWYASFMSSKRCRSCEGRRLKPEVLHILIDGISIIDVTAMTITQAHDFIGDLDLSGNRKVIAEELVKEIGDRLGFLINVGLDYLTLDRSGPTLSGGESQRIRLASQVGSELTGVLYILDEPSIGLHQRDNVKLLKTLCHLRDIGNSLIVVEHDQETMECADWVVDMGPGAGHLGGQVVAEGPPESLKKQKHSLTGDFLAGRRAIEVPENRRELKKRHPKVVVKGAVENNLKGDDVAIPLGFFVCVTGVSGAGKSTLINQILYPALSRKLNGGTMSVGRHKKIEGLAHLDKVINIDQRPIGRTPRSNPATYTKVFDHIRDLFAMLPESQERGYKKGRYSFNVKGGRCETCCGDGFLKVEMHFLADVYVPCESCRGKRFNEATLEIKYNGHSISDVLDLSVQQARELFQNHPKITAILDTLMDVGLSYIKLGQAATTLSGGEAQRIKLARELAKRSTGRTLYILDEPTTGLHFEDVRKLLEVLQRLTEGGNTVLVIEHNLDVIKCADWLIDMGPDGGEGGGHVVVEGSPETVAASGKGHTAPFLADMLGVQHLKKLAN